MLIPGAFVSGHQPDGNSIILSGSDGLIVFDTGRHPAHTRRILEAARATGKPVVALVNSHWHLDHVSGNPMLRAEYPGLKVYASHAIEGALKGFLADSRKQTQELIAKHAIPAGQLADVEGDMATIDRGRELLPDIFVERNRDLTLAGRKLHLGLATDAVTAGDVWLYDVQTRVLLSGDLVTLPAPLLDTACAQRWSAQLATLDAVGFETLVPGHGAPMNHAAFHRYRHAFDALLRCAAGPASVASCSDAWLHDAGRLVPATDVGLARDLLGYYVTQILRAPTERRARYCPT
ncbi:MAG: MBL fold metallo-hydrolase [Rhodanobacteraceae bacterium]